MQDNYNNARKTTTTIHTRQLTTIHARHYNNTHKTATTIHTRQLTITHTRQLTTIHTTHLTTHPVQTVNNTTVRKYCIQFPVFFPTHTVLTLSPQPFTSHHYTAHINVSHKVSFFTPTPTLHLTSVISVGSSFFKKKFKIS